MQEQSLACVVNITVQIIPFILAALLYVVSVAEVSGPECGSKGTSHKSIQYHHPIY